MFHALILSAALVAAPQAPKPATNTICPVTGEKVTSKSRKVLVRGQEYYFCCSGCDAKLVADPGKYLENDGRPRNAGPAKAKLLH